MPLMLYSSLELLVQLVSLLLKDSGHLDLCLTPFLGGFRASLKCHSAFFYHELVVPLSLLGSESVPAFLHVLSSHTFELLPLFLKGVFCVFPPVLCRIISVYHHSAI